ncbi:MAG TPA: dTDP-4-dehydrorhamnose reductase [Chitinophagaceae bacterium]|nr:dTDP-4-dehydrorhamnose reductase [Chitinophagaceae bacterium]
MAVDDKKPVILVTGANGQLGSEMRQLSPHYPGYNFLFASRNELAIEDKNAVSDFFKNHVINYCINCAAYTAVDRAESEKATAFAVNADAPAFLALQCKENGAPFIHISTDYVYDGSKKQPLKEADATGPLNIYGASKLRGEELVLQNNPSSVIIRTSWVYSVYGNNFVKTMLRLFKERDKLNVVNDQVGCPTYAADIASVIMKLIGRMENGSHYSGIVNFCDSGITTWYEFAVAIKEYVNSSCDISPVPSSQYPTPAKRPHYSVLDTAKIKKMLGTEIPSWKDSLHRCLKLYFEMNPA